MPPSLSLINEARTPRRWGGSVHRSTQVGKSVLENSFLSTSERTKHVYRCFVFVFFMQRNCLTAKMISTMKGLRHRSRRPICPTCSCTRVTSRQGCFAICTTCLPVLMRWVVCFLRTHCSPRPLSHTHIHTDWVKKQASKFC